jgi:hypothetical protein
MRSVFLIGFSADPHKLALNSPNDRVVRNGAQMQFLAIGTEFAGELVERRGVFVARLPGSHVTSANKLSGCRGHPFPGTGRNTMSVFLCICGAFILYFVLDNISAPANEHEHSWMKAT